MAWIMYIPIDGGTKRMWLRYNKKFKNWESAVLKWQATRLSEYSDARLAAEKILTSPYMIGDRIYIEEDK